MKFKISWKEDKLSSYFNYLRELDDAAHDVQNVFVYENAAEFFHLFARALLVCL